MNIVKASDASNAGYGTTKGEGDGANVTTNFPGTVKSCTETNEQTGACTKEENVKPDTFLFFNDGSMLAFKAADAAKCTNDSVAGEKLLPKNLAYSYIIHESPSNILCFRKSITH